MKGPFSKYNTHLFVVIAFFAICLTTIMSHNHKKSNQEKIAESVHVHSTGMEVFSQEK